MFFPAWWISEERHVDGYSAKKLKYVYLDLPLQIFETASYGGAVAFCLMVFGAIPWYITNKRERIFRARIYVD